MDAPKGLSLEARRATWEELWRILLAPRSSEERDRSNGLIVEGEEHRENGIPR